MADSAEGLVAFIVFFLLILAVGFWAVRNKHFGLHEDSQDFMLAGRSIGGILGIFTMTATYVGGDFLLRFPDTVYSGNLIWWTSPLAFGLSLIFGGLFFANKMRSRGYVTMLDPLQNHFGEWMGGLHFLPILCSTVVWLAVILQMLGATLKVVFNLDPVMTMLLSASFTVFYTITGGFYAIAYTDVLKLILAFAGMCLCIPSAWSHPAVRNFNHAEIDWVGSMESKYWPLSVDIYLLICLGSIFQQPYFQRVLSSTSGQKARFSSLVAVFGCLIMPVPSMLIGAIARATAWNQTEFECPTEQYCFVSSSGETITSQVLRYLTSSSVATVSVGAIGASVMSSTDSSILSISSLFARNIWKRVFRKKASDPEVMCVMRVTMFLVGALATLIAIFIRGGGYNLPSFEFFFWDLGIMVLIPQLLMVLHFPDHVNTYGALPAYIVGVLFRILSGNDAIGLPAVIRFPFYDEENYMQLFPYRTTILILSTLTLVAFSALSRWLFKSGRLSPKYDFFRCVVNIPKDEEPHGDEMIPMTWSPDPSTTGGTS